MSRGNGSVRIWWRIIVIAVMAVICVVGCGEKKDPIEQYKEMHMLECTYVFADSYETKEKLYKDIVELAMWDRKAQDEIGTAFEREGEYDKSGFKIVDHETELDNFIKDENLPTVDSLEIENAEKELYLECDKVTREYYSKLLKSADADILEFDESAYKELEDYFLVLADAEEARQGEYYTVMYEDVVINDVSLDIYSTLYPEELLKAVIIQIAGGSEDTWRIEKALVSLNKYEEYKDQVDNLKIANREKAQCVYEGCTNIGSYTVDGKPGEYCFEHKYLLENKNRHHGSHSGSHSTENDPYSVYDYSDPEDFYEDNCENFYDYEDAEDYYDNAWNN